MKERPIETVVLLHGEKVIIDANQAKKIRVFSWYLLANGYVYARINGRQLAMHAFLMNTPKGMHTDHINRNKLDNRLKNLRVVEPSINLRNRRSYCGSKNPFYHKTHSESYKRIISLRWSKPVFQISLSGEIIAKYKSTVEAECITGVSDGNISSVCCGRRKTAGGFKWSYENTQ